MHGTLAVAVVASLSASAAGQYASCTFLNTLDGKPIECRAHCISADGKVVAGVLGIPGVGHPSDPPGGSWEAFRWTSETGIAPIGGIFDPPQSQSEVFGASGDGAVLVGYAASPNGTEAFRWTEETGFVGLGDLPEGAFHSEARAVSRDGLVVVGTGWRVNNNYPFRWTADTGMTQLGLGPEGGKGGGSLAVNSDGSIVAGSCNFHPENSYVEAFRWTARTDVVSLGHLPGGKPDSRTRGMTPDGRVIVGHSDSATGYVATRWTEETGIVSIGQLDKGKPAIAYAVSDDGNTIVGGSDMYPDGSHAFLWTPRTGMVDLKSYLIARGVKNLKNRALLSARGISADGTTIVGTAKYLTINGKSQTGPEEAYIVHLGAAACYPDCDGTGELDIDDFVCFQTLFAINDLGADCDESGSLDIDDFICFQTEFAKGCN